MYVEFIFGDRDLKVIRSYCLRCGLSVIPTSNIIPGDALL
jgi:hypothetical protein